MFKAAKFIGIDDFGVDDCFIINKDVETYSVSMKDLIKLDKDLRKKLKEGPEKKYFSIFFIAGHGMLRDGTQWLLLNKLDENQGFYKMYATETEIRKWSRMNMNCYFVAVFACCREIFVHRNHSNCVSATSK